MNKSTGTAVGRTSIIGAEASREEPREITRGEKIAVSIVGAMVATLGIIGFVNSFARVSEAATPYFGSLSWTVPLGIDLGIAIFAATDIVLARLDMRIAVLRLIPWTLTAVTVFLNISGSRDMFALLAHAVLPMLWCIATETGAYVVRKRAGLSSQTRMDHIRLSRWFLSPVSTMVLWRRMVLWEVRSYPLALQRERDRVLARTELQDKYGIFWRWRATRRERAMYRLGELVPTTLTSSVTETEETKPEFRRPRTTKTNTSVDDLMPLGRKIAKELAKESKPLTRNNLLDGLRVHGQPMATGRANTLLNRLKAEFGTPQTTRTKTA